MIEKTSSNDTYPGADDRSKTDLGRKAKRLFRKVCRRMGFVIYRVSSADEQDLPPLLDDPMEVIYTLRGGGKAAFNCSVEHCTFRNGLSLSDDGWNPFRATAEELDTRHNTYSGSILERYYGTFTPENALQAMPWETTGPDYLQQRPSWISHYPWQGIDVDERQRSAERDYERELAKAGGNGLGPRHGYFMHGPTSKRVGEVEYRRVEKSYRSLERNGYLRTRGHVAVIVLRRARDFRFVIEHGHHRVGAAAALGIKHVPALIPNGALIEAKDVDHWPQVRQGTWSRDEALDLFNNLFDFDSRSWASSVLGLDCVY